jgi:hypothetical protein
MCSEAVYAACDKIMTNVTAFEEICKLQKTFQPPKPPEKKIEPGGIKPVKTANSF